MKINAYHSGSAALSELLRGKQIASISFKGKNAVRIVFADDTFIQIRTPSNGFTISTGDADADGGAFNIVQHDIGMQTKQSSKSGSSIISRPIVQPTERETDYLSFIKEHTARFGKPPAQYDMERRFQISAYHAENAIKEMVRKGLITHKVGMPKSLRVCY